MALDRNEIVELVVGMLDELRGSRDINLREVARRLGCAHTSIYNHFPSLEGLLTEAASRAVQDMRSRLAPLDGSRPMPERLVSFVGRLFDYVQLHQGLYVFLWLETHQDAEGRRFGGAVRPETLFEPTLAEWLGKERSRKAVHDTAALLHSYFHGEVVKLVCGASEESPSFVKARILRNTERLLEALR